MTDAEGVHREVRRHQFPGVGEEVGQQVAAAVQRPAAIAEAIEADLEQGIRALAAQVVRSPALSDGEQQRALCAGEAFLLHDPHELFLAAPRPIDRSSDRFLLRGEWVVHVGAVIEADDEVRAIS